MVCGSSTERRRIFELPLSTTTWQLIEIVLSHTKEVPFQLIFVDKSFIAVDFPFCLTV